MKAMKFVLAGCLAAAIAATLWAEVDADYQAAMKGAAGAFGRLKKDIDAKAADDAAKDATCSPELAIGLTHARVTGTSAMRCSSNTSRAARSGAMSGGAVWPLSSASSSSPAFC